MGLVSSLYRMSAPTGYTQSENDKVVRNTVERLVTKHGGDEVCHRIRVWPVPESDMLLKMRLIVAAEAAAKRAELASGLTGLFP